MTPNYFQHRTIQEIEKLVKIANSIISLSSGNPALSLIVFQSKLIVSVTDRTPEQISQPKSKHQGNNLTRLFSHISEEYKNKKHFIHDFFCNELLFFTYFLQPSKCACVWICVCISWITCLYPLSPILTGLSWSTQQQTRNNKGCRIEKI